MSQVSRPYSLVGPEDLVCDLAEEDLLVRPQVRRRSLPDEGFPVEERHLWLRFTGSTLKKGGKPSHTNGHEESNPTERSRPGTGARNRGSREQEARSGAALLLPPLLICPHGAAERRRASAQLCAACSRFSSHQHPSELGGERLLAFLPSFGPMEV